VVTAPLKVVRATLIFVGIGGRRWLQRFVKIEITPFHGNMSRLLSPPSRTDLLGELGEMHSTSQSLAPIEECDVDVLCSSSHELKRRSETGRLLVVQEHELMAAGLQLALSQRQWHVETNNGATAMAVVGHAERFEPHCALLDTHLRHGVASGIGLIAPLAATGARVVMLTAERRRTVLAQYLEAGAVGWIRVCTSLNEVDATLSRVVTGEPIIGRTERSQLLEHLRAERARSLRAQATFDQLTQREALVLAALADGLSADEIAKAHFVALTTVRSQIRSVLQKLGVRTQLAAVALADAHRELLPYEPSTSRDRRRVTPVARDCGPTVRSA
jgi:DNA-binding NarL/FixJ family response regulator